MQKNFVKLIWSMRFIPLNIIAKNLSICLNFISSRPTYYKQMLSQKINPKQPEKILNIPSTWQLWLEVEMKKKFNLHSAKKSWFEKKNIK